MHIALSIPFERAVAEYALWRSVPDDERSGAPAWWWDTAVSLINEHETMPPDYCRSLELDTGSSYAAAATVLMQSMQGQDHLVFPENFPRKPKKKEPEQLSQQTL